MERAERVSGAELRAGRGAGPEGEEGRARDAAGPSAEGAGPRGKRALAGPSAWLGQGKGKGFVG